jgi:hypothetical protein
MAAHKPACGDAAGERQRHTTALSAGARSPEYSSCVNPAAASAGQATDKRVLTAAAEVTTRGLAKVVLLGDLEMVSSCCRSLGLAVHEPAHSRTPCADAMGQGSPPDAIDVPMRPCAGVC